MVKVSIAISYALFPSPFSSKEGSRIGTIRKNSRPVLGRAMKHPFQSNVVDTKSTRELVRNVSYQAHPEETGFRRPGSVYSLQAPRDFSVNV